MIDPNPNSPFFTIKQASDYWGVNPITVERWSIKHNWQVILDPSGRVRFLKEDVMKQGTVRLGNRNRGQFKPRVVEEKTA